MTPESAHIIAASINFLGQCIRDAGLSVMLGFISLGLVRTAFGK